MFTLSVLSILLILLVSVTIGVLSSIAAVIILTYALDSSNITPMLQKYSPKHRTEQQEREIELRNKPNRF